MSSSKSSSVSSELLAVCFFNLDDIALLHLPGACTCFMGTAKAINSYRNHAKLIAPSSSGITTTSSLSSAYSLPNFTARRLWVSIGISISSKHLSHGTTTTPSIWKFISNIIDDRFTVRWTFTLPFWTSVPSMSTKNLFSKRYSNSCTPGERFFKSTLYNLNFPKAF